VAFGLKMPVFVDAEQSDVNLWPFFLFIVSLLEPSQIAWRGRPPSFLSMIVPSPPIEPSLNVDIPSFVDRQ